jgi:hypothetical protein
VLICFNFAHDDWTRAVVWRLIHSWRFRRFAYGATGQWSPWEEVAYRLWAYPGGERSGLTARGRFPTTSWVQSLAQGAGPFKYGVPPLALLCWVCGLRPRVLPHRRFRDLLYGELEIGALDIPGVSDGDVSISTRDAVVRMGPLAREGRATGPFRVEMPGLVNREKLRASTTASGAVDDGWVVQLKRQRGLAEEPGELVEAICPLPSRGTGGTCPP